jgi:Flp pilus assembly pilin Flp
MRVYQHSGQSLLEYIVLIALIAIVAVSLVVGIGQRSTNRFQEGSDARSEEALASATSGKSPAVTHERDGENKKSPSRKGNLIAD